MSEDEVILLVVVGTLAVLLGVGTPLLYARLYRKVAMGQALVINKLARVEVYFTGSMVVPIVHGAEVMDIGVKTIEIARTGKEGVICKDCIRADLRVTFFVRVGKTAEDVLKVAQAIGVARASDQATLEELFAAKFAEAIKTVGRQLDFEELYTRRQELKERILEVIGADLEGYVLDDAAIDYLEQTPVTSLDPNNVLDAEGIRKITEITSARKIATAEAQRGLERRVRQLDVEAKEMLIEIERRQADALARLRADTGRELTVEQLEDRLMERLRELVDVAVNERLRQEG
ncbi:MAG: hypothetical protein KDK70_22135 [Myxococcales bacterium]|nr:hypothetical protein [Myxococcales bacterium]